VTDAALCRYEYSGRPKLLSAVDHPRLKARRRPMRVLRETSVSLLFGGGNQSGRPGMYYATRAVIERAKPHDFALVGVNNIWMSGRRIHDAPIQRAQGPKVVDGHRKCVGAAPENLSRRV
jgi:hypothetical protein